MFEMSDLDFLVPCLPLHLHPPHSSYRHGGKRTDNLPNKIGGNVRAARHLGGFDGEEFEKCRFVKSVRFGAAVYNFQWIFAAGPGSHLQNCVQVTKRGRPAFNFQQGRGGRLGRLPVLGASFIALRPRLLDHPILIRHRLRRLTTRTRLL